MLGSIKRSLGRKWRSKGDDVVDKSITYQGKHFLEAAIVKIMKIRRSLEHKILFMKHSS